jgi:alpha-tubulin suppressor-like RCC1 family protein
MHSGEADQCCCCDSHHLPPPAEATPSRGVPPGERTSLASLCVRVRVRVPITQVSCGEGFLLALSAEGRVLSYGVNYYSQLGRARLQSRPHGHQHRLSRQCHLAPISLLTGQVAQLRHAAAQAERGTEEPRVRHIAAGVRHAIVCTHDGAVYAWGWNQSAQCGLPVCRAVERPTRLTTLQHISAVACGREHSLFLGGLKKIRA